MNADILQANMAAIDPATAERLFRALGDLLSAEGAQFQLVVVGGVAMALGGFTQRTTLDVDVIALADAGQSKLRSADPLPEELERLVRKVARDFGLPNDWLNGAVSAQLAHGLPPGLVEGLTWHRFGGLHIGLAGRRALIALKLFAAADQGPRSKHVSDLTDLAPTHAEWEEATAWVKGQDVAPEFPGIVEGVVQHVIARLQRRS